MSRTNYSWAIYVGIDFLDNFLPPNGVNRNSVLDKRMFRTKHLVIFTFGDREMVEKRKILELTQYSKSVDLQTSKTLAAGLAESLSFYAQSCPLKLSSADLYLYKFSLYIFTRIWSVLWNNCSEELRKIQRKTPEMISLSQIHSKILQNFSEWFSQRTSLGVCFCI